MKLLSRFFADRSGATSIEYGLIATLIAVAVVGSANAVANGVGNLFTNISNKVTAVTK